MITAGVLLAAGRSRRFGQDNKLLTPLGGRPLIAYAANALVAQRPDLLVAVVADPDVESQLRGFTCVPVAGHSPKQSDSLRAGIKFASTSGADRALVVLADMPFVSSGLLKDLCDRCGETTPSAASDGIRVSPPACFPRRAFDRLLSASGDQGGRAILRALPDEAKVRVPERALFDVDTSAELEVAREYLGVGEEDGR
ncbi:MAG: nucleotidyltransferase family protein [Pseudomonadota bacterium]